MLLVRHRVPLLALLVAAAFQTSCAQQSPSRDLPCDPFEEVERLQFSPEGWDTNFCEHSVPYEEIFSGGPPRDGIPPIDAPSFVSVTEADGWIEDNEPVILFEHDGTARAYPLQILTWHEIVNDEIAGMPIAVTFCPLCNAALTFERPVIDGELLTFGTSGNLRHSDLVMWDRQTESWWQQFTGEAIVGDLTGTQLRVLPAPITAWKTVREDTPDAEVLSRDTGHNRPYGRNPYAGYDDVSKSPFLYDGPIGEELPPMARVVGVEIDESASAYAVDDLRERRVINDRVGKEAIVVFWAPGTSSALDDDRIAGGRDVGATSVFRREVDGRTLTFEPSGDGRFVDNETGSAWNLLGEAQEGELAGFRLKAVVHHNIFWFVWSAFQPEGQLYSAE